MIPGTRVLITSLGLRCRVVACSCRRCADGTAVAVDEYLGLKYPAVFPGRGSTPSHFVRRVVVEDRSPAVERAAAARQLGFWP